GLTVTDDQFALAAADRDERVDGLQAGLHRFVHRTARDDAGRLNSSEMAYGRAEIALAVDGVAQTGHDATDQGLAHRNVSDRAGALDRIAFLNGRVVAEDHDPDVVGFEVQRHALNAAGEFDHLAGLDVVEAMDTGDPVTDGQHLADFSGLGFGSEVSDLLLP